MASSSITFNITYACVFCYKMPTSFLNRKLIACPNCHRADWYIEIYLNGKNA